MALTKTQKQTNQQMFSYLSAIVAVILLIAGGLLFWGSSFIGNMVQEELAAQKVYFPEAGSESLDAETYPDLQQYGGELVDTPEEAKAYANSFIGRHLEQMADGKTYSEVSHEYMADPTNTELQQLRMTLFMGEMLRGTLLTSGYGFGTVGQIMGIASYVAFIGAIALGGVAVALRLKK